MKDKKLNQILAAARRESPPAVPANFTDRVLRGLASEKQAKPVVINLWDQLSRGFSRYAIAAAAAIMICAAVEITHAFTRESSLEDDVNQICTDWTLR